MKTLFRNRIEAGQRLAQQLKIYANRADSLVLALPRGGVPVAHEIAYALNLPLDICLVRKLGAPENQECAIGAIAEDGTRILNHSTIGWLEITKQLLEEITRREYQELQRRARVYRNNLPKLTIYDRIVILVDDGLATGATMRAAVSWVRSQQPRQLIVAVPIASPKAYQQVKTQVDRLVCLCIPHQLYAIGRWYNTFDQVTDAEVCAMLNYSTVVDSFTR